MNNIETMKLALEALEYLDVTAENYVDDRIPYAAIAALRQAIEQAQYAEQMELPEPRLTGKFSICAGKFKCTGCTGSWINREDAKHHSCKDYQ